MARKVGLLVVVLGALAAATFVGGEGGGAKGQ